MRRSAEERFDDIYRRHADALTAYVRRRSVPDSVEDVVADTFVVCWRKLEQVPAEPLPWLYAVARKTLANERRAASRPPVATAREATVGTPDIKGDPVLARAFARLGEPDREILRLVAWEQLSLHEAARVLGCSYVACRVRFHRARRRLATHLERLEQPSAAANPRSRPEGAAP
jgi:RNA polymerase sigma-70 factor (ECF subfamily)